MSDLKYRPFITNPGTGLALPPEPVTVYEHMLALNHPQDNPDVHPTWIYAPLSAVPLPLSKIPDADPQQRWAGINPRLMANPLMWLPKHLAYPYRFEDSETEPPSEWIFRVLTEIMGAPPVEISNRYWIRLHEYNGTPLQAPANLDDDVLPVLEYDVEKMRLLREATPLEIQHLTPLYDQASGFWLDIPASHGIDLDTVEGATRMRDWLNGGPDPILDAIDVSLMLACPDRDPDWAEYAIHRPMIYLEHPEIEPRSLLQDTELAACGLLGADIIKRLDANPETDPDILTHYVLLMREFMPLMSETDDTEYTRMLTRILDGHTSGVDAVAVITDLCETVIDAVGDVVYRLEDWHTCEQWEILRELESRHEIRLQ